MERSAGRIQSSISKIEGEASYLFFAKQGKMQEDFDRFRVCGEDDKFGDTAIKRLRSWRNRL